MFYSFSNRIRFGNSYENEQRKCIYVLYFHVMMMDDCLFMKDDSKVGLGYFCVVFFTGINLFSLCYGDLVTNYSYLPDPKPGHACIIGIWFSTEP